MGSIELNVALKLRSEEELVNLGILIINFKQSLTGHVTCLEASDDSITILIASQYFCFIMSPPIPLVG